MPQSSFYYLISIRASILSKLYHFTYLCSLIIVLFVDIIAYNAKFDNTFIITSAQLSLLQIYLILSISHFLYDSLIVMISIISRFLLVILNQIRYWYSKQELVYKIKGTLSKFILLHIVVKVCLMTNAKSNPFSMLYILFCNTFYITHLYLVKNQ